MAASQETLQVENWSVHRSEWGNEQGRVEYLLFPPGVDPRGGLSASAAQVYIQRNIASGELDLRFPTQLSAIAFITLADRFIEEIRGVQAPSRHELLLERLRKVGAREETLGAAIGKRSKIGGYDNGVDVANNSDDIPWNDPDCLSFKASDLPPEGEYLDSVILASRVREKYHGQGLEDSAIAVATESSILSFFPSHFAGVERAEVFVYTPAELTEAALRFLYSAASFPGYNLPWSYIDRIIKGEV